MKSAAILLFVVAAVQAAELLTSNGHVVIQVAAGKTVNIANSVGDISDDTIILTKSELQAMIATAVENATAPLRTLISDLTDRMEDVEGTAEAAEAGVLRLQTSKANAADAVDADDVRTIVAALIANQPVNNALATAFAKKLDSLDGYDDTDAANVVASIVTEAGNTNALREKLDGLTAQLNEVIANQDFDCGSTCSAGEYVQTSCDPGNNQARVCASCATGQFSLGGLVASCVACSANCPAEHHRVSDCTTTRDIKCSKCSACVPGVAFETSACTTEQDRVCQGCSTCGDDEYMVSACNATNDVVCDKCTLCDGANEEVKSRCTAKMNAVCMPTTFGMAVDLESSSSRTGVGQWVPVSNWRQSTVANHPSQFVKGPVAPDTNGFTTPADGYYWISCNLRLDAWNTGNAVIRMQRGSTPNDQDGTNVVLANANFRFRTFTTAAIAKLSKGDKVTIGVYSSADNSYSVNHESSFSVFSVNPTEGVFAELNTDFPVKAVNTWATPTDWRTTGFSSGWSLGPATAFDKGVYTVQQAGIFLVTYNQRFNNAESGDTWIRTAIARNGQELTQGGLHAIFDKPPVGVTLQVSGAIQCDANDTLSPAGWSKADADYTLSNLAAFSVARIETNYAFTADLSASVNINIKSRTAVLAGWRTTGANTLFDRGNVFDETTGTFTAPVDGYYFVAANVRMQGNGKNARFIRVYVKSSNDAGFQESNAHVIHGAPASGTNTFAQPRYDTFTPAGVMKLDKGAQLNIWVELANDVETQLPFSVQSESGFSVVCLKEIV